MLLRSRAAGASRAANAWRPLNGRWSAVADTVSNREKLRLRQAPPSHRGLEFMFETQVKTVEGKRQHPAIPPRRTGKVGVGLPHRGPR